MEKFIYSFFDQNPISQMGVIKTNDKNAVKLCDLLGNPRKIVDKIKTITIRDCHGEPSIQNALEIAISSLK